MNEDRTRIHAAAAGGLLAGGNALRLGIGLCPALAVTTTALNGLTLGIATAFAATCVSAAIAWLKDALPRGGRLFAVLTLSAFCATLAQTALRLCWPEMDVALGVFLPLIAVNGLIVARAEYAAEHGVAAAAVDGLGAGLGYAGALALIGALRELLSRGSVFGARVLPAGYEPMLMMALPSGGLLVCGLALGAVNAVADRRAARGKGASE